MVSGCLRPPHRARKGPQNGRKTARLGTNGPAAEGGRGPNIAPVRCSTEEPEEVDVMFSRVHTRRTAVELVVFLILAVGGSLLLWGGSFASNMVHDQLVEQQI